MTTLTPGHPPTPDQLTRRRHCQSQLASRGRRCLVVVVVVVGLVVSRSLLLLSCFRASFSCASAVPPLPPRGMTAFHAFRRAPGRKDEWRGRGKGGDNGDTRSRNVDDNKTHWLASALFGVAQALRRNTDCRNGTSVGEQSNGLGRVSRAPLKGCWHVGWLSNKCALLGRRKTAKAFVARGASSGFCFVVSSLRVCFVTSFSHSQPIFRSFSELKTSSSWAATKERRRVPSGRTWPSVVPSGPSPRPSCLPSSA